MQPAVLTTRTEKGTISGRILVVDDNESNRDMLSRRLARRGYSVDVATDGRQALEKVAAADFDLVLLDIMMPEVNGYEVLARMKSDEALQHVPVLMISAVDDLDSVVRCIELGADDYLPKPFNPTLLRARVEASLARKHLRDRERMYAQSLEQELEIGRKIQHGFLPAELPIRSGWEIAASFQPAQQVAGDFYDVFELSSDRIGLLIADVCGKGVGAALFMALFRSLLRAFADRAAVSPFAPAVGILTEAVNATNSYITRVHRADHTFASVFFGVLDPNTGMLHYVNAGHLPPVITRRGAPARKLLPTGPAIGLMKGASFQVDEAPLDPGDLLFVYTDGATEARDGSEGFFSEERLMQIVDAVPDGATGLLRRVKDAVREFTREAPPWDDLTLLAIRREPSVL